VWPAVFCSRFIVIEWGSAQVMAATVRLPRRGPPVVEHLCAEAVPPSVGPPEGGVIPAALERVLRAQPRRLPVVLVLPDYLSAVQMLRCPSMGTADRADVIRFEAQEVLSQPLNELTWDHAVVRHTPLELEVMLAAWPRTVAAEAVAVLRSAGVEPVAFVPAILAQLQAVRSVCPPGSAVLVSIGREATELIFFSEAHLSFRRLALGATVATHAVAAELGIGRDEAEALKQAVLAPQGDPAEAARAAVHRAVAAWAQQLDTEIKRSEVVYHRQGGAPVEAIWLTGEALAGSGLEATWRQRAGPPVRRLDGVAQLRATVAAGALRVDPSSLASLAGGARAGRIPRGAMLNLLPIEERQTGRRRRVRERWAVVAAALALGGLPVWWHCDQVADTAVRAARHAEHQWQAEQAAAAELAVHREREQAWQHEAAWWREIALARSGWLQVLEDLHERVRVDEAVWLERWQVLPERVEPNRPARAATLFERARPPSAPVQARSGVRLRLTGVLLDRIKPQVRGSAAARSRAQVILDRIAASPLVASLASERFEPTQPGLLRFELVLVLVWPPPID
jgi:Tfp pilus assembly PilM family ATPase